jgi:hypothetical protein
MLYILHLDIREHYLLAMSLSFCHYALPLFIRYIKHKDKACSIVNLKIKINQVNLHTLYHVKYIGTGFNQSTHSILCEST